MQDDREVASHWSCWRFSQSTGVSIPRGLCLRLRLWKTIQVFEERGGQLDSGPPLLPVEQLRLQPASEGLDDCVVIAVADGSHRRHQAGRANAPGEAPRREVSAVVGMNNGADRCGSIGHFRDSIRHAPLGSTRSTVPTRSIDRSNETTLLIPVVSAQATRYASAKSSRPTS